MATLTDVAEKTATAYMEVSRYQALCDAAQRNIHSLENAATTWRHCALTQA
ncbi:hypothetical protein ACLB1Q_13150 [Escherichia coli]